MEWTNFYDLNLYKRLPLNFNSDNYILITNRIINNQYKRLSILNRLYTLRGRYLIPTQIYKTKNFISTYIYNWIDIDDNWYRICSKGSCKDYILDYNNQFLVHINNIDNKQLLKIINHYIDRKE